MVGQDTDHFEENKMFCEDSDQGENKMFGEDTDQGRSNKYYECFLRKRKCSVGTPTKEEEKFNLVTNIMNAF